MRTRTSATAAAVLILAGLTLVAYLPVLTAGFAYDDFLYVACNPRVGGGLSLEAVRWAFTTFHAANWHPLAWLSHLTDVTLFGLNPRAHHAVNLLLHTLNVAALFLLLRSATGQTWRSLCAAALFAVHPLHVESVAWIAERKDLVATLFWFLAFGAYLRHARRPETSGMAPTALLFALALLAKPMPVTLPVLLLLLDIWPLGRIPLPGSSGGGTAPGAAWRRALTEKAPLLALSLASAAVTFAAQGAGGAVQSLDQLPFPLRLANALLSWVHYLRQTVWPAGFAIFYPHPGAEVSIAQAALAAAFLAAASAVAAVVARRRPHLAFGWAWYLVSLLPVIGLVQVGHQARADRYVYVPLVGIFIALAAEAGRAASRHPRWANTFSSAAIVVILALGALSYRQAAYWKDGVTLFRRSLSVAGDSWEMQTSLATVLSLEGRQEEAIACLSAAANLRPSLAEGWFDLAVAQLKAGRAPEAETALRRALNLQPDYPGAMLQLGDCLVRQGRLEEAEAALRRSLDQRPGDPAALFGLGTLLSRRGNLDAAVGLFRQALLQRPDMADASFALGVALFRRGDSPGAAAAFRETLRLDPAHAGARQALSYIPGAAGSPAGNAGGDR